MAVLDDRAVRQSVRFFGLLGSVALGIDEYYMGVGEAPGVWMGQWSPALGIQGVVEADVLRALIEGNFSIQREASDPVGSQDVGTARAVISPRAAWPAGAAIMTAHQARRRTGDLVLGGETANSTVRSTRPSRLRGRLLHADVDQHASDAN